MKYFAENGQVRLNGWTKAWTLVFREIETLSGPEGDARLAEMAAEFGDLARRWAKG